MNRDLHGHWVTTEPCDGSAGYWRVVADGTFCGLIAVDHGGWRTLPVSYPGRLPCGPVCHCPDEATAVATLVAETIDHQKLADMIDYYARDGSPLTLKQWAKSRSAESKHVAHDVLTVGGKTYRISTVWLGLNHRFGDGPPLIFETMVFPEDNYDDLAMDRYSTETEAVAGHRAMVERVRAGEVTE